jgi:membrane associated rhomboid family serine protease
MADGGRDTAACMQALLDLTQDAPAAAAILALMLVASLLALYKAPQILDRHLLRPYWLLPRRQYAIGSGSFVALYVFGLLVSAAGTWLAHRKQPDYASLGASGAILAVLFASIVYTPSQSIIIFPIPLPIPAPLFALLYLAYTIYASKQARGRINHDAHLSGAVAGVLFVLLTDAAAFGRALQQVFG